MSSSITSTRPRSHSNPVVRNSPNVAAIAEHFATARSRGLSRDEDDEHHAGASERDQMPDIDSTQPSHASTSTAPIPTWQRELAASRVGRQSRASSIFSTRTRLTVQSDDARSVEIEAGGQSFRISRDGSYITNTTAPPPYPGPPLEQLTELSEEEDSIPLPRGSEDTLRDNHSDHFAQLDSSSYSLPLRTHQPPGSVQPDESPSTSRLQRLRSVLQRSWYGAEATTEPQSSNSNRTVNNLRRTQSDSSSILKSTFPDFEPNANHSTQQQPPPPRDVDAFLSSVLDISDEQSAEITKYYTGLIRDLDRQHRQHLHERDEELAKLRELLNEKDIVYRQQLRERDHTIDGLNEKLKYRDTTINELKKRNYETEEEVQKQVERARNEVEDMWEARWKEYEVLLREKLAETMRRTGSRRSTLQLQQQNLNGFDDIT